MEKVTSKGCSSYAELSARTLRKILERAHADADQRPPVNRERIVAVLELALARRARGVALTKRLTRFGVLAAAAGVCLFFGWLQFHDAGAGDRRTTVVGPRADRGLTVLGTPAAVGATSEGAVAVGGQVGRRPLTDGMTLEPGTGLVAPATTEVRIGTPDGTVLTLERSGELTIVEQDMLQRFALRRGAVRARVSKLHGQERFIITTDDAEIEVHGTAFRIAVVASDPTCGAGTRTRVSVSEGVVSVRAPGKRETLVSAGAAWPDGCAQPAAAIGGSAIGGASLPGPQRGAGRGRARTANAFSRKAPSARGAQATGASAPEAEQTDSPRSAPVLAVQNDLFLAAIRARRQQRPAESVQLFSRLIDAYPDGPLLEGAMVQRFQVLRTIDTGAAGRAASQYLNRFPEGYARVEARELAGSGM